MAQRAIVIGHRGASGYLPEHTLASYALAIEQGADFIEPDLVSTRDGHLVARHENEIGGTTDVSAHPQFASRRTRKQVDGVEVSGWFTEDFTLAELKTLRARERIPRLRPANARFDGRYPIPSFEEILALARSVTARRIGVYPETKHPTYFARLGLALEPPLLESLEHHGYTGRTAPVFIQCFEVGNLIELRRHTDLPLVQLIAAQGAPFDWVQAGEARGYSDLITDAGLAQVAGYADAIGVEKVLVVPRRVDGELAEPTALTTHAHAAGLAVHAWTFRAENEFLPTPLRSGPDPSARGDLLSEIEAHLAAGLDGFFTDQPDLGVQARDDFLQRGGVRREGALTKTSAP
ncbi:MAG TPA: glycerophosphodiester phosphodiesterase [Steroidobacteraceae bacterium]|nr:glycerophosphodiester phosphodiesterase [Steroidobacteraceae bacterium]